MPRFDPLDFTRFSNSGIWTAKVTVRFGDCDPAGIVYTPNYFDIFNRVIEEWYSAELGLSYYTLIGQRKIGLGYVHTSADFAQPSVMGDVLDVAVTLSRIGTSSYAFAVHAFSGGAERVRASFVTVTTKIGPGTPMPLPPDLRDALEAYQKRCLALEALAK